MIIQEKRALWNANPCQGHAKERQSMQKQRQGMVKCVIRDASNLLRGPPGVPVKFIIRKEKHNLGEQKASVSQISNLARH